MPTKWLPDSANLDHLKHQAKDLLRDYRAGQMAAYQRIREFHPQFVAVPDHEMPSHSFNLSDAQLSIAREYGYASWPRLKVVIAEKQYEKQLLSYDDRLPEGPFKQALQYMDAGDGLRLKELLEKNPGIVHEQVSFEGGNYFSTPTLLEFLPENPIRQGKLPSNVIAIAEILLVAGASENHAALNETLMLTATGQVCRECGVQNQLLKLLCRHGADPSAAMHSALAHQELEAARILIEYGASLDLPAAATLDERDTVRRMTERVDESTLQLALSLAANAGRNGVVKILLESGADPNRYNPPGAHSHCTPLHSAVASNQYETVKTLIEGGANADMKDIHHKTTALGWAEYLKHERIAGLLQSL